MRWSPVIAAALAASALADPAAAVDYVFTLTESRELSWVLPAAPEPHYSSTIEVPFSDTVLDQYFDMTGVAVTSMPSGGFTGIIEFRSRESTQGGLAVKLGQTEVVSGSGPQLFTGSVADPTFRTGTFSLTDPSRPDYRLSLHIAAPPPPPPPAVPEPATWAMLIAGFGLTGAALRRRRAHERRLSHSGECG